MVASVTLPSSSGIGPSAETRSEPALARLADATRAWLAEHASVQVVTERRLAALVTTASVYASHCAPTGASERELDVVARFTLLFFLVDDAALDELPDLLAADAAWSIGRYTSALRAWLGDFPEQASPPTRLRQRFARGYHDYLAARKAEHLQQSRPLDVAEHWALRRRTIFMNPYLDLWMMLRGVEAATDAEERFAEARSLAIDLVLLANDLGSAERDSKSGASPDDLNLIHSYAREHGESEAAALERLVELHNDLAERYRGAVSLAVATCAPHDARRYADILSGVVEGNVASVLALGFRYPGAAPVMKRLTSVR
jgi:hypothetical protein